MITLTKYNEVIHVRLSANQKKWIEEVADEMKQSSAQTVRDMIDLVALITSSNVTLRDVLITATPRLMQGLIDTDPGVAKTVIDNVSYPALKGGA